MLKIKSNRQKLRFTLLVVFMLLFPVIINYLSPYLIIVGASEGIVNGSMLVFAGLLVSALAFGRGWCSWVCPAGGLGEVCSLVQPKDVGRKTRWIKWGVWGVWLLVIAYSAIQAGGYKAVNFFFMTEEIVSITHPFQYIIYYFVTGSIVVLGLTVGKRGFCHTLCWMAPFMIIGRKVSNLAKAPALRLYADVEKCTACNTCNRNCPMSLDVHQMVVVENMENLDCILCGNCVDGCTKNAISYQFAKPQV